MILKYIDWATFRVVVQRRGICAGDAPLSLVSVLSGLWANGGGDVLWGG
jgi:hypothetical protein